VARTILEIAQEAATREATAPAPTALFNTNDRIAKILRGAAKDTLREYLRRCGHWEGLSEFHSTWVWATVPGRFAYPLPPDYLRSVPGTERRGGWPLALVGPATPQDWARWVFGGASQASPPLTWRMKNNLMHIEPAPETAHLVSMEYISRYPVVSDVRPGDYDLTVEPPQTMAPLVPRDGHLALTSWDLVEAANGDFDYDDPPGWDEGVWPTEPMAILRRINPVSHTAPLPQVRRPEFTADDDRPAFEDDYLLSLGMTFRLRRALGLPYSEAAAELEAEMEAKAASDGGGARTFRIGGVDVEAQCEPLSAFRWVVR
jgi:hypothetical protein